ncbi:MAG TPA: tryptophan synthase subunit alpha [Cellvibrionaceae bacterium]
MNRINQTLATLKNQGRKALATYIVCGDPKPTFTLSAMHALVEAGADIIELGVPFSDPMAEGPVIQKAHERALAFNTSLRTSLEVVTAFRTTNPHTPVVLMGYANPVERMGYSAFVTAAVQAGVDGLLTVDLPPEEAEDFNQKMRAAGLETIYLVAPTTATERVRSITAAATGFVYYVSLKGVTGAGNLDIEDVASKLEGIRSTTQTPVLVGFGIKDAVSAKAVAAFADGVVVGSALVELMAIGSSDETLLSQLAAKVRDIRQGLDSLS